jgi:hypothetical protein
VRPVLLRPSTWAPSVSLSGKCYQIRPVVIRVTTDRQCPYRQRFPLGEAGDERLSNLNDASEPIMGRDRRDPEVGVGSIPTSWSSRPACRDTTDGRGRQGESRFDNKRPHFSGEPRAVEGKQSPHQLLSASRKKSEVLLSHGGEVRGVGGNGIARHEIAN